MDNSKPKQWLTTHLLNVKIALKCFKPGSKYFIQIWSEACIHLGQGITLHLHTSLSLNKWSEVQSLKNTTLISKGTLDLELITLAAIIRCLKIFDWALKTPWDTKAIFSPGWLNSMAKLCNSDGTGPIRAETRRLEGMTLTAKELEHQGVSTLPLQRQCFHSSPLTYPEHSQWICCLGSK